MSKYHLLTFYTDSNQKYAKKNSRFTLLLAREDANTARRLSRAVRASHTMSGESAYRTVAWAGPPPNIPACKAHNASRTLQVHVPPTTPQSWEENVAHGVDRDAGDCPCGGGRPAASVLYLLTGYTY